MNKEFLNLLQKINIVCTDDGSNFIQTERLINITDLLGSSRYEKIYTGNLCHIYARPEYRNHKHFILISSHIDSLYDNYFFENIDGDTLLGTFDNSITNTVLIDLMLKEQLPPEVIITFTGNEENDCGGAEETIKFIQNDELLWPGLELVITLDITSEGYAKYLYTIENYFIEKDVSVSQILIFSSKKKFKNYFRNKLANPNILFISDKKAGEDESWTYDEYDLNCITFCIPTAPHPDNAQQPDHYWMHSDKGMFVMQNTIGEFWSTLNRLCNTITIDLNTM